MLIAISGSQGSGKSTILNELKKQKYNVIERKTSRSILSDWNVSLDEVNSDVELSLKFQEEIINRKHNDEFSAVISPQIWFTERTFIDVSVYNIINLAKYNEHNAFINQYHEKCVRMTQTYSLVFYLQGGLFSVQNDNVRGINMHYSKLVDMMMLEHLTNSVLPDRLIKVNTPSLESRILQVTTFTNSKLGA